ncbi:AI-2E family transporter [Paenibacillus sp. MAHUQ-46]|uniref:AI-2E family transporter n=2 Tax=Paenibacillus TaxID=44249 RepID=A0A934MV40_9BACL|nr:AI-2E family transporter [Paenibacillus roseus]
MRPAIRWLEKVKNSKAFAILILYGMITGLFTLFFFLVWPTLREQLNSFVNSLPQLAADFQKQFSQLQQHGLLQGMQFNNLSLTSKLSEYIADGINAASAYVSGAVSFVTTIVVVTGTVPIMLYYLLKQDQEFYRKSLRLTPGKYRRDLSGMLLEIDRILSEFILGRFTLCLLLGGMIYIGFLIIDLPYSLLLALFAALMNLIPYIGQIIGLIPALIVAFIDAPSMAIWVIVIHFAAQQIEGNLLSPHIYGRKLNIHPMTTITLLLVAGSIGGIVGIMTAIPFYLIVKIIVVKLYRFYQKRKQEHVS